MHAAHANFLATPRNKLRHDVELPRAQRGHGFTSRPNTRDGLQHDGLVRLVLDAVSAMDRRTHEGEQRGGGLGQAPFAPAMQLVCTDSNGAGWNRAIGRLYRHDAGCRHAGCEPVPDPSVSGERLPN